MPRTRARGSYWVSAWGATLRAAIRCVHHRRTLWHDALRVISRGFARETRSRSEAGPKPEARSMSALPRVPLWLWLVAVPLVLFGLAWGLLAVLLPPARATQLVRDQLARGRTARRAPHRVRSRNPHEPRRGAGGNATRDRRRDRALGSRVRPALCGARGRSRPGARPARVARQAPGQVRRHHPSSRARDAGARVRTHGARVLGPGGQRGPARTFRTPCARREPGPRAGAGLDLRGGRAGGEGPLGPPSGGVRPDAARQRRTRHAPLGDRRADGEGCGVSLRGRPGRGGRALAHRELPPRLARRAP